jgi:hypothetical protein
MSEPLLFQQIHHKIIYVYIRRIYFAGTNHLASDKRPQTLNWMTLNNPYCSYQWLEGHLFRACWSPIPWRPNYTRRCISLIYVSKHRINDTYMRYLTHSLHMEDRTKRFFLLFHYISMHALTLKVHTFLINLAFLSPEANIDLSVKVLTLCQVPFPFDTWSIHHHTKYICDKRQHMIIVSYLVLTQC